MIKELENISEEIVKNKINEMINSINKLQEKEPYTGLVIRECTSDNRNFRKYIYYINNGIILGDNNCALPILITSLEALVVSSGVIFKPIKQIQETLNFDDKNKTYSDMCLFVGDSAEKGFTSNKIYKMYYDERADDYFLINDLGEVVYSVSSKLIQKGVLDFVITSSIGEELKRKEDYFRKLL